MAKVRLGHVQTAKVLVGLPTGLRKGQRSSRPKPSLLATLGRSGSGRLDLLQGAHPSTAQQAWSALSTVRAEVNLLRGAN